MAHNQPLIGGMLAASAKISGIALQVTGPGNHGTALADAIRAMMRSLSHTHKELCDNVQWINIYADMRRDGRFPADVVDVLDTCHAAVGFALEQSNVDQLHRTIITRITPLPAQGLTNLLAREAAGEESIICVKDGAMVLGGVETPSEAVPSAVAWYKDILFPDDRADWQYVHIRHPALKGMRTLGLNCCGAYLMSSRPWEELRPLFYPVLRMAVLELGALVSNWLSEELQNEHRRQREVADMVHRRAARATRDFSAAVRSLTMLRDLVAPEVAMLSDAHELRKFFVTEPSQVLNARVKLPCAHDWQINDGQIGCSGTAVVPPGRQPKDVCAAQTVGILLAVIGETESARDPLCRCARRIFEGHHDDGHRLVAAIMTFLPALDKPLDAGTPREIISAFRFARRCFHEPYKFAEYKLDACPLFFFAHAVWLGRSWKWGDTAKISGRNVYSLDELLESKTISIDVSSSRGIDTVVGLHHVVSRYGGLTALELGAGPDSSFVRMTLGDAPEIRNADELSKRVRLAYQAERDGELVTVGDHTAMFLQLLGAAAESVEGTTSSAGAWEFTGQWRERDVVRMNVTIYLIAGSREFKISWTRVAP